MSANLEKALKDITYRLQREARVNLSKAKKKDTGRLSKSLRVRKKRSGKSYTFVLEGLSYGNQVDQGRGPSRNGGNGSLWFEMLGWVSRNRYRLKGKRGQFGSLKDYQINGLAYIIAQKIHKRGYIGINFLESAINSTQRFFNSKLKESIDKDIKIIFDRNGFN
mgnify:CR=1 FL=1